MTEVAFHPLPVSPQKRSHSSFVGPDASFQPILPPVLDYNMTQPSSPAPSTLSSLTDISAIGSTTNVQTPNEPPTKKRKLNFIEKEAEKAAKQRERDEKQRLKAEEKTRKDEEKARKDEEKRKAAEEKEDAKRVKEVEKAEKQKVKDAERSKKEAEKAQKDAEKAVKEAERLKKERSQMRLGAFFAKPTTAGTSPLPSTPDDVSEGMPSRRSSVASIDVELPVRMTQMKPSTNTDFEKWILPFFVPENTAIAPHNRFKSGRQDIDDVPAFVEDVKPLSKRFRKPRERARRLIPVKELLYQMQEPANDTAPAIQDALQSYSFKIIQFHENVRPPYQGTVTRSISPRISRRLAINPNCRELPDLNYDYDSEAEWEPPAEDDEDLDGEDEMSDIDDNEEEMADFLDDAEDIGRRKGLLADMEPVSSGLCWNDSGYDDNGMDLVQYRMDVLHDSVKLPINPFSTKHWTDTERTLPANKHEPNITSMQPPRYPLATLTANTIPHTKKDVGIDGKSLPSAVQKAAPPSNKPVKLIDSEYMPAFKEAIVGSDLTKAGLIEVLKKQFPKCSKDAIKDTIGIIAVRVGKKESEKKWDLIDPA